MGSQEAALQDVDCISFLFSTMTGFSSDKLASLQEAGDDYALAPSPLSPLCLYPTPLEQFTHHWDIVEVRSQTFPAITHPTPDAPVCQTLHEVWIKAAGAPLFFLFFLRN